MRKYRSGALSWLMLWWVIPLRSFYFCFLSHFPFSFPFLLTTIFSCFCCLLLPSLHIAFFCVHVGMADRKVPTWPCWSLWSCQQPAPYQIFYRPIPDWNHFRFLKLVWRHSHVLMSPGRKIFQYLPQIGEYFMTSSQYCYLRRSKRVGGKWVQ